MPSELNDEISSIDGTSAGQHFYFDYKDGSYGYNTSPLRGADTFSPFKGGLPDTYLTPILYNDDNVNNSMTFTMNVGLTGYEVAAIQTMRSSRAYTTSNSGLSGSQFTSSFNGATGDLTIDITNNHILSNYPWYAGATVLLSKNGKYVITDKLNIREASGLNVLTITFNSGYTGYTYVGLKSVDSFRCYQGGNYGDSGMPFTLSIDSNTGIISLTSLISSLVFLTRYAPSGFVFILAKD